MMMEPMCFKLGCIYLQGVKNREPKQVYICKAYPNGIPNKFSMGKQSHKKVEPGQVGTFVLTRKK